MSDILQKAFEILDAKVKETGFDRSVKFVINGEGEVTVANGAAKIADEDAELTLTADADVFEKILDGELSGASAFMTNQLSVDGDMGLAMQLGTILG